MNDTHKAARARLWVTARRAAVLGVVALAGARGALLDTGLGDLAEFAIGALIGSAAMAVALLAVTLGLRLVRPLPASALAAILAVLVVLIFLDANSPGEILRTTMDPDAWNSPVDLPHGLQVSSLFAIVAAVALLVALLRGWWTGDLATLEPRARSVLFMAATVLSVLCVMIVGSLVSDGEDPYPSDYRTLSGDVAARIDADDPSAAGGYPIEHLSYGAGENRRRPDFGAGRRFESRTVDAAPLLEDWKGVRQRMRERYWGFGLDQAPLNGLVWTPQGDGPFPLVLIVHGNHAMEAYSDPGYAYLGELLASRGFIAVSVDENFINGSWSGDFRGKEMALRAWLLLEHLRQWRDWNTAPGHPFAGRVDMDRVALVGHSRGGEAVSIAYAYNALPHHPDDATVDFDYGFGIRSLVAIAPVDHRYHRRVELEDVNFLTLQGSYDSDEPAFHGLRQFNRIALGEGPYRFKAGIYVHGANHGQFNSTWGREDSGPPDAWLLNLAPIIPPGDQRRIASVYIAAFLEATLRDRREYLRLFRDPRAGADWLPDHAYAHQFMDSTFVPIATFEEDLDVTTATADGAAIAAEGFSRWREEELKHRDERGQGTNAVVLGWHDGDAATYTIDLAEGFWPPDIGADDLLTLAVSGSTETLPADDDDADANDDAETPAPRFVIEAEDTRRRTRRLDTREFSNPAPPLRVRYLKSERLNKERYRSDWEPVLTVLEVPLSRLLPEADAAVADLRYLRLRFEGQPGGVVILDDIGIRRSVDRD